MYQPSIRKPIIRIGRVQPTRPLPPTVGQLAWRLIRKAATPR